MKLISKPTTYVALASIGMVLGCSATTPTAQKAATAAVAQLTAYEVEIQRKIKAENDFYESALTNASNQVERLWKSEQRFEFLEQTEDFAERNSNLNATQIGPKLVSLMETTKTSWEKRDMSYEALLIGTQSTLRDNRKQLEQEKGKIKTLRGRLQVLSAARSDKETLALMIAFSKQVKEKYDELSASADAAAEAGSSQ